MKWVREMNIKRILLLAGMALAAIAFAAPAIAQANVFLTEPAGTKLAVGAKVTATSTNLKVTVDENTLTCGKVTLHYEVVTNGLNSVILKPVNTPGEPDNGRLENCVLDTPFGTLFPGISNFGFKEITFNTWGTGEVDSTFTAVVPPVGLHCSYTGRVHVQATNGTDLLHFKGPLSAPGCPDGEIHGLFTIETSVNPLVPVITDNVPTP